MTPEAVVRDFLDALEQGDLDRALPLLADDVRWINVSLPTIRGRDRIGRLGRRYLDLGMHFRVHFHHVAANGDIVLTERSDALGWGRFEQRFWVHGRFEVRDGRIAVWRDSFDYADYLVGLLRGLAGIVAPGLNRPWPGKH